MQLAIRSGSASRRAARHEAHAGLLPLSVRLCRHAMPPLQSHSIVFLFFTCRSTCTHELSARSHASSTAQRTRLCISSLPSLDPHSHFVELLKAVYSVFSVGHLCRVNSIILLFVSQSALVPPARASEKLGALPATCIAPFSACTSSNLLADVQFLARQSSVTTVFTAMSAI
jgi:hypothetical protein